MYRGFDSATIRLNERLTDPIRVALAANKLMPRVKMTDALRQYDDIADAIHGRGRYKDATPGDVYQALMTKEESVLKTVNRVVNDAVASREDNRLVKLPLHVIGVRLIRTLTVTFHDLLEARSIDDVWQSLIKDDRPLYIGMMCIATALIIMTLDSVV